MGRWRIEQLLLPLLFVIPAKSIAGAQAIEIAVRDVQYRTDLSVQVVDSYVGYDAMRTELTTSEEPISTSLDGTDLLPEGHPGEVRATAVADTFGVSTSTRHGAAVGGHAWATAETTLSFNVLQNVVAPLSLSFEVIGQPYSDGLATLYDNTTNTSLLSFSWACCFYGWQGNAFPNPVFPLVSQFAEEVQLLESHIYTLTMRASTYARDDGQSAYVNLAGLAIAAPVPEPAAWAMMLAGLVLVGGAARHRARAATTARV